MKLDGDDAAVIAAAEGVRRAPCVHDPQRAYCNGAAKKEAQQHSKPPGPNDQSALDTGTKAEIDIGPFIATTVSDSGAR